MNRQLQEKDKMIESLNQSQYVHNFKYGVLINQNEELTERLKQKDEIISLLQSIVEQNKREKEIEYLSIKKQLSQFSQPKQEDRIKSKLSSTTSSGLSTNTGFRPQEITRTPS